MWHCDRPQAQQKLASSLAQLVNTIRTVLFVPFLAAFWTTLTTNFQLIDSLRLNKFLLLIRNYVHAAFAYLHQRSWPKDITSDYLKIIEDMLVEIEGRVSDGLRYHILDVWVDELGKVDEERKAPLAEILTIVVKAKETGRTKILKARAQEVLDDERLSTWATVKQESAASKA